MDTERRKYDAWLKDDGEKQWWQCPECDSRDVIEAQDATHRAPPYFLCADCPAESLPRDDSKH